MNSVKTGGTSPQIPDTGQGQYPSQATPPLTGCLQGRSCADNQSTRPAYNPIHTNPTNDTTLNSMSDSQGNRGATDPLDADTNQTGGQVQPAPEYPSASTLLTRTVEDYIKVLPPGSPINRTKLKEELIAVTRATFLSENTARPKLFQLKIPTELDNAQIAKAIELTENVKLIVCSEDEDDPGILAVYDPEQGIYITEDRALDNIIEGFKETIKMADVKEVRAKLQRHLPKVRRCLDPNLVPVDNGIFDYKAKVLLPFDPDKIFLTKSRVNYNPNATNIIIHNTDDNTDWDVESWMASLSSDAAVVHLLWEILGAIVRPFVRWDKAIFLYSQSGNSGKGTLCALMRNLCGKGSHTSIPISDFSVRFRLSGLLTATAVIVDENDVGVLLDKVSNFKAVITGDVVLIEKKYKDAIPFQPMCVVVQCLNELPRSSDRTPSLTRRQLIVPFDKNFSGVERRYIKDDYLGRTEVLEYVLYKVLNMPSYYEFDEPDACRNLLEEYKELNDPIREFVGEVLPQLKWDLLPYKFLYELFKKWMIKNRPAGKLYNRGKFNNDLLEVVKGNPDWFYRLDAHGKKMDVRVADRMSVWEPLASEYNLDWEWAGPDGHSPPNVDRQQKFKGLERRKLTSGSPSADDD